MLPNGNWPKTHKQRKQEHLNSKQRRPQQGQIVGKCSILKCWIRILQKFPDQYPEVDDLQNLMESFSSKDTVQFS